VLTIYSRSARVNGLPTTYINVKWQTKTLAGGWYEKSFCSCDKRILRITQKPIAGAENAARKTVPKTFFLGDSARDRQPIACAIWDCLGAIILSQDAAVVSLLHLWGPEEQAAFKDLQAAITESMTLAFQDLDKRICVLTGASDRFYAGLVTQIHEEQLDLPMKEQDHQPLAFLSGEFKGAALRWTTPE
jgi:RNase H-like domain found in reverse transcriptase